MIKKIYKRLDSTNHQARLMLEQGDIDETTWIRAEEQYMGKGLDDNNWISEAGKNITGSAVVFPSYLAPEKQFSLSVACSLALCDLLELYLEDVKIKWPNDIYAENKKIAGLLIEHSVMGRNLLNSILGIGLNINQLNFPPDLLNPTSLRKLLGFELELDEVEDLLLDFLEARLARLEAGCDDDMRDEYHRKLYRYKEYAPYKTKGKWFRSRITGIDSFGLLQMETETGESLEFGFKEVEFID